MPQNVARIAGIGFSRVGNWFLQEGQLEFILDTDARHARKILYAFVADGVLAYIGKTNQSLQNRLQRYKTPAKDIARGGSTNFKNNRNIRENLSEGHPVEIYALLSLPKNVFNGFQVNFAAGLEDDLIAEFRPPWNAGSVKSPTRETVSREKAERQVRNSRSTTPDVAKPTADDFRAALYNLLGEPVVSGESYLDVLSSELHRRVGGYPQKGHRMPICCSVMRQIMKEGDEVLSEPPKGMGASLKIRYLLPR